MKTKLTFLLAVCILHVATLKAQTNTFPQSGNVGIGTLTPATDLQVIGTTRMGSTNNYAQVDGSGNLSFKGSAVYKVGGNKYAFQYSASPGYGLFFNSTDIQYEFRDAAARPVFYVNANSGDGYFLGTLQASRDALINGITVGIGNGNSSNTAIGYQSLYVNAGDNNTATGYQALTSNTTGYSNTANGYKTLYANTTGHSNTATGVRALYSNSTGYWNTAYGYEALYSNTTSFANAANGYWALYSNTTGSSNTATGYEALYSNTTANDNTAHGTLALFANTSGYNNTATGSHSLYVNTLGYGNTADGSNALYSNTTGFYNTANGFVALYYNTTGNYNTANGMNALYDNTTGDANTANGYDALSSNTTGTANTASGYYALYNNTTGIYNVAIGGDAMYYNTIGSNNTSVGDNALRYNTTGSGNTAAGFGAGLANTTGFNNTIIGNNADLTAANFSNNTTLGNGATGTASNQVRIGNSSVTSIGGYRAWTNISDGRVKKNIKANVPGLSFINLLKPVTYNLDLDAADKLLAQPPLKDKNASLNDEVGQGKIIQPSQEEMNARHAQEQVISTGFIAQDVEAAAKKLGYDFDGVDAPKNDKDLYGLRYSEFVVPLVKAVQELSQENNALKSEVQDLKSEMEQLKSLVLSGGQSKTSDATVQQQKINISNAALEQNIPNPFTKTTAINYNLPQTFTSAKIMITDNSGKVLKEVNISQGGKGGINVDASALSSGDYRYSLYLDGKLIDTKQMEHIK